MSTELHSAAASRAPEISVVIPIYDARAGEEECVQSWTDNQDFPRERYEVVIVSDDAPREVEERISGVLGENDRVTHCSGLKLMGQYHEGAKAARGSLVLFTELHCVAKRDCLSVVSDYFENNDCDGGFLASETGKGTAFAYTEAAIFDDYVDGVVCEQDWRKVLLRGFVIKRDVYQASGGLDPSLSYFGDLAYGAILHSQARKLNYIKDGVVEHYYSNGYRHFVDPVRIKSIEECTFRLQNDPGYCDTYFNTPLDWLWREASRPETARRRCLALGISAWNKFFQAKDRRGAGALARALLRLIPQAVVGLKAEIIGLRIAMWRNRYACWRRRNNVDELRKVYPTAFESIETYHRLRFISDRIHKVGAHAASRHAEFPMPSAPDIHLTGFYHREMHQGRAFRWASPAAVLSFDAPQGRCEFELDIGYARVEPETYFCDVFANGHRLSPASIAFGKDTIKFTIEPNMLAPRGWQTIVLTSVPIQSTELRDPDARELGIPVFDIRCRRLRIGNTAAVMEPDRAVTRHTEDREADPVSSGTS